jgi:hypothetical protein
MSRSTPLRKLSKRVIASTLPFESRELRALVMERISRDQCMECGAPRRCASAYCGSCLVGFPIRTDLKEAFDGWRYEVWQTRPAYDTSAFRAVRVGIHERKRQRTQWLSVADTFEQAKEVCFKALRARGC